MSLLYLSASGLSPSGSQLSNLLSIKSKYSASSANLLDFYRSKDLPWNEEFRLA